MHFAYVCVYIYIDLYIYIKKIYIYINKYLKRDEFCLTLGDKSFQTFFQNRAIKKYFTSEISIFLFLFCFLKVI